MYDKEYYCIGMVAALLIAAASSQDAGCGDGSFMHSLSEPCSEETCTGDCVDSICCLETCFDGRSSGKVCSSYIEETGPTTEPEDVYRCRRFVSDIECIATFYNKTTSLCRLQVLELIRSGVGQVSKDFNPLNCPCTGEYTRADGWCSSPFCQENTDCVNETDTLTGSDVCCMKKIILPHESACNQSEYLDQAVQTDTLAQCEDVCTGTCRITDNVTNSVMPSCCKLARVADPKRESRGQMLHPGIIVLLVLIVIIILVAAGFGLLYIRRARGTKQQKPDETFDGIEEIRKTKSEVEVDAMAEQVYDNTADDFL